MKIFCDIGNTFTSCILYDFDKIVIKKIFTKDFFIFFKNYDFASFYISCVVDEVKNNIKNKIKKYKLITYKDLKQYIKIKYNAKNLGTDRLLNAFAVKELIGYDSVIISLGTAIVLDYINKIGEYEGGEIFTGFNMLRESLYSCTSKLPLVSKKNFYINKLNLIGKDTKECIVYGIMNFCISGVRNFVNSIKPKNIIFTGGDTEIFVKFFKFKNQKIIKELVLVGIVLWCYYNDILSKKEFERLKFLLLS